MKGSKNSNLSIEKWDSNTKYAVKQFDCGNEILNKFLKTSLKKNVEKGYEQAFVLVDDEKKVVGFLTLHPFMIGKASLQQTGLTGMPQMVSAIRLKMLAVDLSLQGQGIGKQLMKAAFHVTARALTGVGGIGLYVDADSSAVEFYQRLSFIELPGGSGHSTPMLLAKDTLLAAIAK